MSSKLKKLSTDALTYQIIGAAMAIHRALGPGLKEATYEHALHQQLQQLDIPFESQVAFGVVDPVANATTIGYYIADVVVDRRVIVELKALGFLDNSHVAQVIAYLAVSGLELGLLIDFGGRSLGYRRVLRPRHVRPDLISRHWLFVPDHLNPNP